MAALVTVLVCSGCSITVGKHSAAPLPSASPTHHQVRTTSLPRLLPPRFPPTVLATPPPGLTAAGRSFVGAVNGFCRDFYVEQRAADLRHFDDPHAFAVAQEREDRALVERLTGVHPPDRFAQSFAGFLANEQRLVEARVKETSLDPAVSAEGDDEYNGAVVLRHSYAHQLGAAQCDGLLPPAEWRSAARAAQRFTLATRVHEECDVLVTRQYLGGPARGPGSSYAACARALRLRHRDNPGLRNIRVSTVTGVEGLSSTVTFREVPECGCGDISLRMYFEHGRWLVNSVNPG